MKYILRKTFRFEAAHRLSNGYQGKCATIHGHSWNGHVEINVSRLDEQGIAIDYKTLKELFIDIVDSYDHSILVGHTDHELVEFCEREKQTYHVFPHNPTSEVIARSLFMDILSRMEQKQLNPEILGAVVIEETCTSSCRVERNYGIFAELSGISEGLK